MRTIQLLQQIIDIISKKSVIIPQLPWDDVELCILSELEERHFLYPSPQFGTLTQELKSNLLQLKNAVSSCDNSALIYYLSQLAFAIQFLPDKDYSMQYFCQYNYNQTCLKHFQKNTIIVLGDSHVNFFSGNNQLSFLPIGNDINTCSMCTSYPFTPLHIGPCLAYHCNDYGTTFLFREKVEYLCDHFIKPNATIICCLGEIDLRVHVFKQTSLQNKTYQEIADSILEQYIIFLIKLQKQGYSVYCWAPIASQPNTCPLDLQFPRSGSEEDRNRATSYFNRRLSELCLKHNIGFLSIFDQMITPDYKTRTEFLSEDQCHLGQAALPLALSEWFKINHPTLQDNHL